MACTYCYAQANATHKKRIQVSNVTKVTDRYSVNRLLVFGGDPLVDQEFLIDLRNSRPWHSLSLSTNGVLLEKATADTLLTFENVHIQVSVEPWEWGYRVTADGRNQMELLEASLPKLAKRKPTFRVTIPGDAPHVSLIDFIDRLAKCLGSTDFTISYWPARGEKVVSWLKLWIDESYEVLRGDKHQLYKGKLLGSALSYYFFEMAQKGFRFANCNAGYGSVSLGPDGRLYACHELAVIEDNADCVSSAQSPAEVDADLRMSRVSNWLNVMNNDSCVSCEARFLCGGLCFVDAPPQCACDFVRQVLPLCMSEMILHSPRETFDSIKRCEERLLYYVKRSEEIAQEVASDKWKQLVCGELPAVQVVELAEQFLEN